MSPTGADPAILKGGGSQPRIKGVPAICSHSNALIGWNPLKLFKIATHKIFKRWKMMAN